MVIVKADRISTPPPPPRLGEGDRLKRSAQRDNAQAACVGAVKRFDALSGTVISECAWSLYFTCVSPISMACASRL